MIVMIRIVVQKITQFKTLMDILLYLYSVRVDRSDTLNSKGGGLNRFRIKTRTNTFPRRQPTNINKIFSV